MATRKLRVTLLPAGIAHPAASPWSSAWAAVAGLPDGGLTVSLDHRSPSREPAAGWTVVVDGEPWQVLSVSESGVMVCGRPA